MRGLAGELIRDGLRAWNDPRKVIPDAHAPYFGAQIGERTVIPEGDALLGTTRFEDWLSRSTVPA